MLFSGEACPWRASPQTRKIDRMKTSPERTGKAFMKPKRITLWAIMIICLVLMQMTAGVASPQPLNFKVIAGQWARIDGSYTLRVENVMSDGTAEASYFNPGRIHVAESRVSTQQGRIKLFVKLQDKGYPGCTYTLFYYPEEDVLAGVYYQAAVNRTYEVIFVRPGVKK
jgi:hypothetical protein